MGAVGVAPRPSRWSSRRGRRPWEDVVLEEPPPSDQELEWAVLEAVLERCLTTGEVTDRVRGRYGSVSVSRVSATITRLLARGLLRREFQKPRGLNGRKNPLVVYCLNGDYNY